VTQIEIVTGCPLQVKLHDYGSLSFYEQVKLARETDIMLGMHGAALTSGIYIPKTGVLLEIGHPSRRGNEHFSNLASFVGLDYNQFEGDDILQPHWRNAIVEGVVSAVKNVQKRKAEFKSEE
jgi:hypothetical protein